VENYFFDKLFANRFHGEDVMRIRYEELASNTEMVLQRICGWLGLVYEENMLGDFRSINHGIAGNPMRHRKGGIKLDEKWRQALSPTIQRVVRGTSWWLSRKYGYVN
jgi:hypothetical protein